MSKLLTASLAAATLLATASAAQAAGDGSVRPNYNFALGYKGFNLKTDQGLLLPAVLVGFNPQPDPPAGFLSMLDLSDPTRPVLMGPLGGGDFHMAFSLVSDGNSHLQLDAPGEHGAGDPAVTGFERFYRDHRVVVSFHFLGDDQITGWNNLEVPAELKPPGDAVAVGFNWGGGGGVRLEQPDLDQGPEVDLRGGHNVAFQVTVDGQLVSFSVTPEPGAWALMIFGFGASGAMLRRARRDPAVA